MAATSEKRAPAQIQLEELDEADLDPEPPSTNGWSGELPTVFPKACDNDFMIIRIMLYLAPVPDYNY